jgi:hypothetical protein
MLCTRCWIETETEQQHTLDDCIDATNHEIYVLQRRLLQLKAAQQSVQSDVAYCYGKDNHLLKEGELCGECGFPKPPRR